MMELTMRVISKATKLTEKECFITEKTVPHMMANGLINNLMVMANFSIKPPKNYKKNFHSTTGTF